jgi:hypothetical protein
MSNNSVEPAVKLNPATGLWEYNPSNTSGIAESVVKDKIEQANKNIQQQQAVQTAASASDSKSAQATQPSQSHVQSSTQQTTSVQTIPATSMNPDTGLWEYNKDNTAGIPEAEVHSRIIQANENILRDSPEKYIENLQKGYKEAAETKPAIVRNPGTGLLEYNPDNILTESQAAEIKRRSEIVTLPDNTQMYQAQIDLVKEQSPDLHEVLTTQGYNEYINKIDEMRAQIKEYEAEAEKQKEIQDRALSNLNPYKDNTALSSLEKNIFYEDGFSGDDIMSFYEYDESARWGTAPAQYDIVSYIRDTGDVQTLRDAGFTEESIEKAQDLAKLPESMDSFSRRYVEKNYPELAKHEYRTDVRDYIDSPEMQIDLAYEEAHRAYAEKYGDAALAGSIVGNIGQYLISPARALKPEVTVKDISGMEWALGGAQVALLAAPGIGAAVGRVGGTIIAKALQAGAGAVFVKHTVDNWDDMSTAERSFSVAMDALILFSAIPTKFIKNIKTTSGETPKTNTLKNNIAETTFGTKNAANLNTPEWRYISNTLDDIVTSVRSADKAGLVNAANKLKATAELVSNKNNKAAIIKYADDILANPGSYLKLAKEFKTPANITGLSVKDGLILVDDAKAVTSLSGRLTQSIAGVKDTIIVLRQIPGKIAESVNNTIRNVNILAYKVLSGEASSAIINKLKSDLNTLSTAVNNLSTSLKIEYIRTLERLDRAVESIKDVSFRIGSGELSSKALSKIKTALKNIFDEISKLPARDQTEIATAIKNLRNSIDNTTNLLKRIKFKAGELYVDGKIATSETLSKVKTALGDSVFRVRYNCERLAENTRLTQKIVTEQLSKAADNIENTVKRVIKTADDIKTGKATDAVKESLRNNYNKAVQSLETKIQDIGQGLSSVKTATGQNVRLEIIKVLNRVDDIVDSLKTASFKVGSGQITRQSVEALKSNIANLRNEIQLIRNHAANLARRERELFLNRMNNSLINLNKAADRIKSLADDLTSGKITAAARAKLKDSLSIHQKYLRKAIDDLKVDFSDELKLAKLERVINKRLDDMATKLKEGIITPKFAEMEIARIKQSAEWLQHENITQGMVKRLSDRRFDNLLMQSSTLDRALESLIRSPLAKDIQNYQIVELRGLSESIKSNVQSGNYNTARTNAEQMTQRVKDMPDGTETKAVKQNLDDIISETREMRTGDIGDISVDTAVDVAKLTKGTTRYKAGDLPNTGNVFKDTIDDINLQIKRGLVRPDEGTAPGYGKIKQTKAQMEKQKLIDAINADNIRLNRLSNMPGTEYQRSQIINRLQKNMDKLDELRDQKTTGSSGLSDGLNKKLRELGYSSDDIAQMTERQKVEIVANETPKYLDKPTAKDPAQTKPGESGGVATKEKVKTKTKIEKRVMTPDKLEQLMKEKTEVKPEAKPATKTEVKPDKKTGTSRSSPETKKFIIPDVKIEPYYAPVWEGGKLTWKLITPVVLTRGYIELATDTGNVLISQTDINRITPEQAHKLAYETDIDDFVESNPLPGPTLEPNTYPYDQAEPDHDPDRLPDPAPEPDPFPDPLPDPVPDPLLDPIPDPPDTVSPTKRIKLDDDVPGKTKRKPTQNQLRNAVAWPQGFGWWVVYKDDAGKKKSYFYHGQEAPSGVQHVTQGEHEAYRGIQQHKGDRPLNFKMPMGAMTVNVTKAEPSPGKRGAIQFTPAKKNSVRIIDGKKEEISIKNDKPLMESGSSVKKHKMQCNFQDIGAGIVRSKNRQHIKLI